MGRQARWEYLCRMWSRYREAGRAEKGRLLDEVCRVTGYHRKYAVRCLNGPPPESRPKRRRLRGPSYGKAVDQALRLVWEASNYPWSVRLKALLPLWLPWLKKRLSISARLESQLLRISPRQIDRRLGQAQQGTFSEREGDEMESRSRSWLHCRPWGRSGTIRQLFRPDIRIRTLERRRTDAEALSSGRCGVVAGSRLDP